MDVLSGISILWYYIPSVFYDLAAFLVAFSIVFIVTYALTKSIGGAAIVSGFLLAVGLAFMLVFGGYYYTFYIPGWLYTLTALFIAGFALYLVFKAL